MPSSNKPNLHPRQKCRQDLFKNYIIKQTSLLFLPQLQNKILDVQSEYGYNSETSREDNYGYDDDDSYNYNDNSNNYNLDYRNTFSDPAEEKPQPPPQAAGGKNYEDSSFFEDSVNLDSEDERNKQLADLLSQNFTFADKMADIGFYIVSAAVAVIVVYSACARYKTKRKEESDGDLLTQS